MMRPQKLIIHIAGNDIDHMQIDEALVREDVSKKNGDMRLVF